MGSRWQVVDELVHELGSLRAVIQQAEGEPALVEGDVTLELRTSLAQAADTIHLVIGGDEQMVAQAWRSIVAAQEVSRRAREAIANARATRGQSQRLRSDAVRHQDETRRHVQDLTARGKQTGTGRPSPPPNPGGKRFV